jgi:hypothetical protein
VKFSHAAALVLVGWYLMEPPPLHVAGGPVAVPGTADVEPGWFLMQPPNRALPAPPGSPRGMHTLAADLTAPFSRWALIKTFPTEKECRARAGNTWVEAQDRGPGPGSIVVAAPAEFMKLTNLRCIASDAPRLKEK